MSNKYKVKKRARDAKRWQRLREFEEKMTPLPEGAKEHLKSIALERKNA